MNTKLMQAAISLFIVLFLLFDWCGCTVPYKLAPRTDAAPELCGNGVVDEQEECDRFAFNGLDCSDLGYWGGALSCREDCTAEDRLCWNEPPE